jgi:hypothetical protein
MSQHTLVQKPWRVEADTLPGMEYENYRYSLIYETNDIKDFLALRQTERTILVAPKGYGKTLLLIAKRKSLQEAKSGIMMAQNVFIDRPSGTFPIIDKQLMDLLSVDYEFWKSLWKVAIALAAIKTFIRSTKDTLSNKIVASHDWYKKVLRDDSKYFEAGELFTDLMGQGYKFMVNVLEHSNFLFPYLNRINTPIVFFIDNVDEYFRPVLEDHSHTQNANSLYRNRNNMIWTLAQIALTSVAYELEKTNHHLKIFCTMRQEAFLRMADVESDAFQISGRCIQIKYSPSDLEHIFLKNIEITMPNRLVEPHNTKLMARFVGPANIVVNHRFVPKEERIFDFFLRHSLYRPRDLMFIGGEVAKIDPPLRQAKAIQDAVDTATKTIVDSIFAEMRPFFAVPDRNKLFPYISSNVLSLEQLQEATKQYLRALGEENATNSGDEVFHPFCVLNKLGLLGRVRLEFENHDVWRQSFLQPTEIQMSNDVGLPHSKYYLLHPALDQSVHERSSGRFTRLYHRQNIVGNQLHWEDPVTYSFVVKGDMVGYSDVMNSEMYEVVTRKLHEWARETCRDLVYVDVSGGDSIVLIDDSPVKLMHCARQLVKLAAAFRERPMQIRFGGAAGPIVFERLRRLCNGGWEDIIVPLGLALRTSARLEPYAHPGHILVEEKFHEFGTGQGAGLHDVETGDVADAERLEKDVMSAVSGADVHGLKYDHNTERFSLQKNPLDPPYYTKLWQIKLL